MECRAVGARALGPGYCWRSKGFECCREAVVRNALALPLSGTAREASRLYDAAGTQWRAGMGGPTGLDYAGVQAVAVAIGVDFRETFPYLQVLEVDQLGAWSDERKAEEKKVKRG